MKSFYNNNDSNSANQRQLYDVAIVGAGVTGTSIYINIIEEWIKAGKKGAVVIIEQSNILGPGLPYHPAQSKAFILNDFLASSDIVNDEAYSFARWLKLKKEEGDPEILGLDIDVNALQNYFPPRAIFGRYAQWTFKKATARAIEHGILIDMQYPATVTDAYQNQKQWILQLNNQSVLSANNLILATGHMPPERYVEFEGISGFFSTPWGDLSNIPSDEPIAVLGSGLSAIDAAKKLLEQGHKAKIYFISPSGSLPSVKPRASNQPLKLKFLNREQVDKPNLSLNEYLELCRLELSEYIQIANFNKKYPSEANQTQWIRENVEIVEKGIPRIWHLLLHEVYFNSLPFAWKHFSKEEKVTILKEYFGPYMKWAAGMPLANAKAVLTMLETEQLEIMSGVPEVKADLNGFCLEFKESTNIKNLNVKYVINATGLGHNIDRNPLLKKLHARNLIKPAAAGGIATDSQSYTVCIPNKDAAANKEENTYANLFAAGPAIFGSNPAVYAIGASAYAGRQISQSINKKPINTYSPGLFHLKNKQPTNDTTNLSSGYIPRIKSV